MPKETNITKKLDKDKVKGKIEFNNVEYTWDSNKNL